MIQGLLTYLRILCFSCIYRVRTKEWNIEIRQIQLFVTALILCYEFGQLELVENEINVD